MESKAVSKELADSVVDAAVGVRVMRLTLGYRLTAGECG